MQKLMRTVVGTNNVDNCSRICHAPSAAGLTAAFGLSGGTNPADDIERADCLPARRHQRHRGPSRRRRADQAAGAARSPSGRRGPAPHRARRTGRRAPAGTAGLQRRGLQRPGPAAASRRAGRTWTSWPRAPTGSTLSARSWPHTPPSTGRAGLRRTGGEAARCGAPVRHRRGARDRLRTRGHRARARHRRRPHPGEPGHPPWCGRHRARRRCQPAARPEQRPGGLGHGRAAGPAARATSG